MLVWVCCTDIIIICTLYGKYDNPAITVWNCYFWHLGGLC